MNRLIIYIILLLTAASGVCSKELKVVSNDYSAYPLVKTAVYLYDSLGVETNPSKARMRVTDNQAEAAILSVEPGGASHYQNASILIAVDLAGKSHPQNKGLELSRKIAASIVRAVNDEKDELAIVGFDHLAYMNADFTNDRQLLLDRTGSLENSPGSDLNNAFMFEPTGIFAVFKAAAYNKTLVIIGDSPVPESVSAIRQKCLDDGIRVVYITIFSEPDQSFKELCTATGGLFFEALTDESAVGNVSALIGAVAHNIRPATVNWQSVSECTDLKDVVIEYYKDDGKLEKEASARFSFVRSSTVAGSVKAEPASVNFGIPLPGGYSDETVTITAFKDVTITAVSFDSPEFSVVSGMIPSEGLALASGESHSFGVRFLITDSLRHFACLTVRAGNCPAVVVPVVGGYPNKCAAKSLKLTNPGCSDTLFVNDTCPISWEGTIESEPVSVDYSLDNSGVWVNLLNDYKGLNYKWLIPALDADSVVFRVVQNWPPSSSGPMALRHKAQVLSAFFNRLGNELVTVSGDSTVHIWDSYSGNKLWEFNTGAGKCLWAEFSADGSEVVFTSGSHVLVCNPKSGYVKQSEALCSGSVTSVAYSPDGLHIAASCSSGELVVLELPDLTVSNSIDAGQSKLFNASFSPDGNLLISSGSSDKIKTWAWPGLAPAADFDAGSTVCMFGRFSKDQKKFVAASWYGKAFVWPVTQGKSSYTISDTLYTVTHMKDTSGAIAINYAEFLRDSTGKELLMTAGLDKAALWNAADGKPAGWSRSHSSNVSTASANFDGSRIVTASWDSTAVINTMFRVSVQTDESDCHASLAKAEIARYEIDFGEIPVNAIKDTLIINGIEKISGYNFEVEITGLTGSSANSFTLISPLMNKTIGRVSSLPLYVRYQPKNDGVNEALLNVKIPGKTVSLKFNGNAYTPAFSINKNAIDFGEVDLGDFKDSLIGSFINNISPKASSVRLVPDNTSFKVSGDSIAVIDPGMPYDLGLRYFSDVPGRQAGLLNLTFDTKPFTEKVVLFAGSVPPKIDTLSVTVGNVSEKADRIIHVPVVVTRLTDKGAFSRSAGLQFGLSFNETLLEPLDKSSVTYRDGKCTMVVTVPWFEGSSDTLLPAFRTGLGNDSVTVLAVGNVRPVRPAKVHAVANDGVFRLSDVCRDGGGRLFEDSDVFLLQQNVPNPFTEITRIDFVTIENSRTTLTITDMLGNEAAVLVDGWLPAGLHYCSFDGSGLGSGVYYYTIRTGSMVVTKEMMLIKQ